MLNKIEGISAETVESLLDEVREIARKGDFSTYHYGQKIHKALLASGEVVLGKDVEELVKFAQSFHVTVTDSYYKDVYLGLHDPHSLTIRLANDSTKSFIFEDLEKRRVEALARFTTKQEP